MALGLTSSASAQDSTVTLAGSVVDSLGGQTLEKVEVYLPNGSVVWTNRSGQFSLSGVNRSEPLLFLRRIGYRKRAIELDLAGSASRIDLGRVWFAPMYFALDTIRVEADLTRSNPKLTEFFRRRKNGQGQYLTQSEIFKRNPFATTDLFRTVAGVGVRCTAGPCTPVTTRQGRQCPMKVMIDGMPVTDFDLDMISPNWIAGIEVYRSAAWTPMELGRSGCGTVVIWTGGER